MRSSVCRSLIGSQRPAEDSSGADNPGADMKGRPPEIEVESFQLSP